MLASQLQKAENAFRREKDNSAQLRHAQITRAYGYFRMSAKAYFRSEATKNSLNSQLSKHNYFYLVQEYIEGHNLAWELKHRSKANYIFLENEALEFLQQLLEILGYIHARNEPVIHRDIKPSNIVRSNEDGRYYLVDFGSVKQIIRVVEQGLSENETHFVTRGISPPEQYDGQVDFSSDLYSLAMTCVCLLTGKALTNDSASSDDLRWLGLPYNRERWKKYTKVSVHLTAIINRMVEPERQKRY